MGTETFRADEVEFVCRIPTEVNENSRIMVLFGGRNWPGEQTLKTYRFDSLADKHRMFLLSPSFVKGDYWEPEKGSGKALKSAVASLMKKYRLNPQKLLFYGYSAGGQCANLFYAWMPDEVQSWGTHACGVYFTKTIRNPVPALLTCGIEEKERMEISRQFLYRYRESGGVLLWKNYPNSGHDLNPAASGSSSGLLWSFEYDRKVLLQLKNCRKVLAIKEEYIRFDGLQKSELHAILSSIPHHQFFTSFFMPKVPFITIFGFHFLFSGL